MTNQVGERLSQENYTPPSEDDLPPPAQELIVQIDGGHIPTKEKGKRSFEALSGVVYRPSSIDVIDQHHRRISDKSCVISALDDDLHTIKTYLYHAALKQGLYEETHLTALADGAKNCWSSVSVLKPHCKSLETILDWFHIGKKFQNVINALDESLSESLEKAKWSLWHGDAEKALSKIALIRDNIRDDSKISKLNGLSDYLTNNLEHLVNYEERKNAKQVFTSQTAESHIDTLINERHKRKQKMQWTREGAHNVMQIRASMESNEWDEEWLDIVMLSLQRAA